MGDRHVLCVRWEGVEVAFVDEAGNLHVPGPDGFASWVLGADKSDLDELARAVKETQRQRGNNGQDRG